MIKINITTTPVIKEVDQNITVRQLMEELTLQYGQQIKMDGNIISSMDLQKKIGTLFYDGCTLEINSAFSRSGSQQGEQLPKEEKVQSETKINQGTNQMKEQRNKLAKKIRAQLIEQEGLDTETCFLVDVTGSMDPYKEQIQQFVNSSMANIKMMTGGAKNWACIAYQDKAEFKQRGNKYQQIDFTNKPAEITEFLSGVKCEGGGDVAEDLQGGMEQMLKLKWTKQYKMCICITDSPCHGKLYNNGCSDNHKDDDIKPTIEKLADYDFILIGINFTDNTQLMYKKFEEIYKSKNKGEMCIILDMNKIFQRNFWEEIRKAAANRVTQTEETLQVQSIQDRKIKDILKKISEFKNVFNSVSCTLEFIRIQLEEQEFEKNIEQIHKIDRKGYKTYIQEKFECIRTAEPFQCGQQKAVFLMQKQKLILFIRANSLLVGQNQIVISFQQFLLSIIDQIFKVGYHTSNIQQIQKIRNIKKGLYETLDMAISECRSHLISKLMMRKFMKTLREETQKQGKGADYPNLRYSKIFIARETQGDKEVFWIAERFFKGEFRKYNNNVGYINDATDMHNRFSQAFTYYSYWISNFNFMVNDVQGVSNYFTDPALNTIKGDFDDTDIGVFGQAMFLANFETKKDLCKDILDTLGIYPNE